MVTRLLPWLSLIKKVMLIAGVLIALYALVGFLVVPYFIKSTLSSRLSEQLDRPVSIREVKLNPFALSLTVGGLQVNEQDRNPLLGFDELYINVQSSSLIHRALTFDEIRLNNPYGVVKIRKGGTLNLAGLGKDRAPAERKPESGEPRKLPAVIIDLLEVDQGLVEFHDETKPKAFQADIVPIHLTLKNFRTRQNSESNLELTAELGPGELLEWHGNLSVDPLRSDGKVALIGLKARSIWEYLKDQLAVEVTDGVINLTVPYHFQSEQGSMQASVSAGELSLSNFALREKGTTETLISLPALSVRGIEVDIPRHIVAIESIASSDARFKGFRDRNGTLSYQRLFSRGRTVEGDQSESVSSRPAKDNKKPWAVTAKSVDLENYAFMVEDQRPATPVKFQVDQVTLRARDLQTKPQIKAKVDLALRFNESGGIATTGSISMSPLVADLDVSVSELPFEPFQPYVDQFSQVRLITGAVNLKGHVRYRERSEREPLLQYQGTAGITRFALADTHAEDLLKWEDLSLKNLSLDVHPTRVSIAEIEFHKPFAKILIGPDKSFNITEALKKPQPGGPTVSQTEATQKTEDKPVNPVPVRIDTVRIINASTEFADLSIIPQVSTKIVDLHGTIKGLSSKELARADVDLQGAVDKYAPVKISGQINPLGSDAFTDLSVLFKNVELTSVSPYSAKYAGYHIAKGKLSLDLRYNLSKKHLDAENKVLIDQLTLGEKVESPDATSLPVKLALALLTDRKGQIDIDLPVKGNLNDPDFRYGRLVLQALGNLITKVVTSPFSAIAALVGGREEDLSEVDFQSGSITLPRDKEASIKSLAKALEERPGLRLEIAGTADPAADRVALSEVKLRQDLERLEQKGRSGGVTRGAASGEGILPDEGALLRSLYQERLGRREMRQSEGAAAKNVVALKTELLQTYTVEDAELRRLAEERAGQVRDHLLGFGGVKPEQVFLLEPKIESTPHRGGVPTKLVLEAQ
jgi:uncharacterized protein DUF748